MRFFIVLFGSVILFPYLCTHENQVEGMKIQLFKNFRSNQNILNITNSVLENIMSAELGDIDYTEEEFLNFGASYPQIENGVGKSAG